MTRERRLYPRIYGCLADAADKRQEERFRGGPVGVWYARPKHIDELVGRPESRALVITRATFAMMSARFWSPHGEADAWLTHLFGRPRGASCFLGDIFDMEGKLYPVEFVGFTELP